jgi:flagellar biosynthetic protein FlhB
MSEGTSEEDRTEEPSARRLQKAREDGEAARSNEVPAAAVMIAASFYLLLYGGSLASELRAIFTVGFVFDQGIVADASTLPTVMAEHIGRAYLAILPLLLVTVLAAVVASGLTGGYLFSMKAAGPNFGKLSPLAGLKRMFGMRAIVELCKTILKFALVAAVAAWVMNDNLLALLQLGVMSIEPAAAAASTMIVQSTLIITLSFVMIGLMDAFYQKHEFNKRMRMSKQEIRDEMKDIEGRPEVRAQIRQRQRAMATSRMMERVKDADVVITNPEHFAVALAYDPSKNGAPILLAKGVDDIAFAIIEAAKKNGVHTFQAPPLARALYFTTKINQPIHEELYFAVAQVIAYVFSLNTFQPGMGELRKPVVDVPSSVRFDTDGNQEVAGA